MFSVKYIFLKVYTIYFFLCCNAAIPTINTIKSVVNGSSVNGNLLDVSFIKQLEV